MSHESVSVDYPITKIATVLAVAGIATWSDAAAALAATYTTILISEWVWRRLLRPYCERRGWVERRMRRKDDFLKGDPNGSGNE